MIKVILVLLMASVGMLYSVESPSALQVYNVRFTAKPQDTIQQLRALHEKQPADWRTRFYLATVLIENAVSDKDLREADELLDGAETVTDPDWIAPWALARRFEMFTVAMETLQRKGRALYTAAQLNLLNDSELRLTIDRTLKRMDTTLVPIRGLLDSAKLWLTADEVREDLYTLKNLIASRWAYVEEKRQQTGRTLDELLAAALAEVKPRMSARETREVLARLVSALSDGHAWVTFPGEEESRVFPFRVEETAEGLVVAEVLSGSPLQRGDKLLGLEGLSTEKALERAEQGVFASSNAGRRWYAVRFLPAEHWYGLNPSRVTIERGGQARTVELKPVPLKQVSWLNREEVLSSKAWLDARMLSPRTGYLRIATWFPLDTEVANNGNAGLYVEKFCSQLDAAVAKVKGADDLVIDVRGNGGGRDELCSWLASYFVPDPMHIYVLRYRQTENPATGDGFGNPERKPTIYPRQPGPVLPTRLWVLTDGGCFSATDTFLNILTRNIPSRVKIVGRSPNGGIGGPNQVGTLRNTKAVVTVSTCKAYAVTGELLEGNPVKVDLLVQWRREDIINGHDPDFEAALTMIRQKQ